MDTVTDAAKVWGRGRGRAWRQQGRGGYLWAMMTSRRSSAPTFSLPNMARPSAVAVRFFPRQRTGPTSGSLSAAAPKGSRHVTHTSDTREVHHRCMTRSRTNIDDGYVETVMARYGIQTKTEAVHLALRHLAGQP